MDVREKAYKDKIAQLKLENEKLKILVEKYEKIIIEHGLRIEETSKSNTVRPKHLKLKIYKDYFKGREDCYAVRFEGKEKSGYAPRYKREYRYTSNQNRKDVDKNDLYEPLTDKVIETHLKGTQTIGLYPMLSDQKTYLLAIDFDKQSFKEDVGAFYNVAENEGFHPLIELSRSGKGAHIWFFFQDKVSAKDARNFGKVLLSKTMLEKRSLSLDSYDRMFPAQDYIDDSQIGNLIALPLNGESGKKGTTLFVDKDLNVYEDQYGKLIEIKKISENELNFFLEKTKHFQASDAVSNKMTLLDIKPLDFLGKLVIKIGNEIQLPKSVLTPRSEQFFIRYASLLNPEYYKKKAMRYSTYNTPRVIEMYKEDNDFLYLPRGLFDNVINVLDDAMIDYDIIDERQSIRSNETFKMTVDLYDDQKALFDEVITSNQGIIVAPTGFGKTVLGIALTDYYKMNTLILTNRVNICKQWKAQFIDFSNVQNVGICYGSKCELGHSVDIATFQSLNNYKSIEDIRDHYGLIIIDEVHHLAAYTFEQVIRIFSAKYIYGLTATPKRSDGLELITHMLIGNVIAEGNQKTGEVQKNLYIRFMDTQFQFDEDINEMTQTIIHDKVRNKIIVDDILDCTKRNKTIMVLTERVEHLEILKEHVFSKVKNLFVLHGKLTHKKKNILFETIKKINEPFVILATGKYIGEGFDDDRLDTLFLTMPFKWRGTLAQYVGRLNRKKQGKNRVIVYDYVDISSRIYSNMFLKRQQGYKTLGFKLIDTLDTKQYLYNQDDYEEKLIIDLKSASESVEFMIRNSQSTKLNYLVNKSRVKVRETKHDVNMIIIDKYIVWYGSINPFTYSKNQQESILRIESSTLAKKLSKQKDDSNEKTGF